MKILLLVLMVFSFIGCKSDSESTTPKQEETAKVVFNKQQWLVAKAGKYPYRDAMVNDVLYNDTIRSLNQQQIKTLLGTPEKEVDNHWYYLIDNSQLGSWTLHEKTMVIKFTSATKIEWIKLHE